MTINQWDALSIRKRKQLLSVAGRSTNFAHRRFHFLPMDIQIDVGYAYAREVAA